MYLRLFTPKHPQAAAVGAQAAAVGAAVGWEPSALKCSRLGGSWRGMIFDVEDYSVFEWPWGV